MSLITENSIVGPQINNELTKNNKWNIAIFPPGYEIIDTISGGDKIGLYLMVCDCVYT